MTPGALRHLALAALALASASSAVAEGGTVSGKVEDQLAMGWKHQVEVVIMDPAYLALLAGAAGARTADTGPLHERLAGADRSAIDRLTGHRSRRRLWDSRTRRRRSGRHGRTRRTELGGEVGARWDYRTRDRELRGQAISILRELDALTPEDATIS